MPAIDRFETRATGLDAPADDLVPVTPSDATDLAVMGKALYVETGGAIAVITKAGETRTINVPSFFILPLRVARVLSTGTTATGIWAFI